MRFFRKKCHCCYSPDHKICITCDVMYCSNCNGELNRKYHHPQTKTERIVCDKCYQRQIYSEECNLL